MRQGMFFVAWSRVCLLGSMRPCLMRPRAPSSFPSKQGRSLTLLVSELDTSAVILSWDGRSAYDSVSRAGLAPRLLPFARQFYGLQSQYWWWDDDGACHVIHQGKGCEQGDPWRLHSMRWANTTPLRLRRRSCARTNFWRLSLMTFP